MKEQKRNDSVSLKLTLEHSDTRSLSSSLVTEAQFVSKDGEISVSLHSDSFNDARARWNPIMRALIASHRSLKLQEVIGISTRPSTEDIQALARSYKL